ncbi:MAG: MmgE/PrpD family protein [Dehalococcoidia bacterium]
MDKTTEMLSSFACSLTYDDLTPQTIHQTKRTLVDSLACALGGFHSEPAEMATKLARTVTSTLPSRILGTEHSSSPDMAGFANSVMIRYLDYNDLGIGGHPSDSIPGSLAMADYLRSDGRSVITSIVVAYEVSRRVGDYVQHALQRGWDHGVLRSLGAACAAGKIMGLDQEKMGHAISLAVVPNLSLGQTRVGELSVWKGCAGPYGTKAGIFAAQLAERGMSGPFEPFDGSEGLWAKMLGNPVQLEDGWEEPYSINETRFKFFPSQGGTQVPTGLAVDLHPHLSGPEDIEAIRVYLPGGLFLRAVNDPEKWHPKTRETADHSIPYLVAVALQDGEVTPESFSLEKIQDPAIHSLISRMNVEEDPEYSGRYPEETNCRLEITTADGQQLTTHSAYPKGHPRNPMSDADIEAKFRNLSAGLITQEQCNRALSLLWSLEEQPDLEELLDTLVIQEPSNHSVT